MHECTPPARHPLRTQTHAGCIHDRTPPARHHLAPGPAPVHVGAPAGANTAAEIATRVGPSDRPLRACRRCYRCRRQRYGRHGRASTTRRPAYAQTHAGCIHGRTPPARHHLGPGTYMTARRQPDTRVAPEPAPVHVGAPAGANAAAEIGTRVGPSERPLRACRRCYRCRRTRCGRHGRASMDHRLVCARAGAGCMHDRTPPVHRPPRRTGAGALVGRIAVPGKSTHHFVL